MTRRPVDAVVVGSGANALGALRSLAAGGLRTALVSRTHNDPARWSRYAAHVIRVPSRALRAEEIAAQLPGRGAERPALVLTEEEDVTASLRAVESWHRHFCTWLWTGEVAARLLSKAGFDRLGRQAGAPLPRAQVIAQVEEIEAVAGWPFPLVVKPVARRREYAHRFARAYRFDDAATLRERLPVLLSAGVELIVQEHIPGPDSDIYFNFLFVDAGGRESISFAGRKLLCWPAGLGGTAACAAAPEAHDQLTEISQSFVRSIGFRGLIGIEYKRDRRTGDFVMIEPTVYRTDYQHEVAALSGCDLLAQACRSALWGEALRQPAYSARRCWVDFPAARYAGSLREVPWAPARRMDAYLRWRDPVPGLVQRARFLRDAIAARFRRRAGGGRPAEEPQP